MVEGREGERGRDRDTLQTEGLMRSLIISQSEREHLSSTYYTYASVCHVLCVFLLNLLHNTRYIIIMFI